MSIDFVEPARVAPLAITVHFDTYPRNARKLLNAAFSALSVVKTCWISAIFQSVLNYCVKYRLLEYDLAVT